MNGFWHRVGEVWEQWYREWCRLAFSLTKSWPDAEDLVMEAIQRSLEARPNLDGSRRTWHYIATAIRNRFYEKQKQRLARRRLLEVLSKESDFFQSSFLEEVLAAKDDGERRALKSVIWDYVARLPDEGRDAIEVRFHTDDAPLSFQKVAAALGISVGTAHARVHVALATLLVMFREDLD